MSNRQTTWTLYESPLGTLTLIAGARGITRLHFPGEPSRLLPAAKRAMADATAQLDEYFTGQRSAFELALELQGSDFQTQVWQQLLHIPHGSTISYGEMAARIDESLYQPGLETYMRPRVVGAVIAANPIPIVVPCHRVIGADGSLTGYRGGLPRKRALLKLEHADAVEGSSQAIDESPQLSLL